MATNTSLVSVGLLGAFFLTLTHSYLDLKYFTRQHYT